MPYYVSKNGSDFYAGTSRSAPFRTIDKALQTMPIAGNDDIIVMGGGTYEEDSAGAGTLNINRAFTGPVVLKSESGVRSSVRITGSTSATLNIFAGAANNNLTIQDLTLGARLATNNSVLRLNVTSGLTVKNCNIEVPQSNASTRSGVALVPAGATIINGFTLDNCDIDALTNTNSDCITISAVGAGSNVTGASILRSRLLGRLTGINMLGGGNPITGVLIEGNTIRSLGSYCVKVAQDSHVSAGSITATIRGNLMDGSITLGTTCHGLLLGAGALNCLVEKNTVIGGDYGAVFKSDNGSVIRYNSFEGGPAHATNCSAMYFKGSSTNADCDNNTLYCRRGTTGVLRVGVGDDASVVTGLNFQGGLIIADGTGVKAYGWPTGGDAGNVVCDLNRFVVRNSANYGDLRAGANLASLAALQAAWGGYGVANNDANSTNVSLASTSGGGRQNWSW